MLKSAISDAADLIFYSCSEKDLERELFDLGVFLPLQSYLHTLTGDERHKALANTLASALGPELLLNNSIRELISQHKNIPCPKRWTPGGRSEAAFCADVGLPEFYSGTFKMTQRNAVEHLPSKPPGVSLLDFQRELINKTYEHLVAGESALISIPTGAGKTIVATNLTIQLVRENIFGNMVWVAHTEELCEQALNTFKKTWAEHSGLPELNIFRMWGRYFNKSIQIGHISGSENTLSDQPASIIISTPQSLLKLLDKGDRGSEAFRGVVEGSLTIIDEAHRAGAASYLKILRSLDAIMPNRAPQVVGLSATPIRNAFSEHAASDSHALKEIFKNLVEPSETLAGKTYNDAMVELGVLAMPRFFHSNITSLPDIAKYIAEKIKQKRKTNPVLIFCATIAEAQALSSLLFSQSISSATISSQTSSSSRSQLLSSFASGYFQVLCNCELLTTGYDLPSIDMIFILRETSSFVLYKQMIGRALRGPRFGGTETADIYLLGVELDFPMNVTSSEFIAQVWS